MEPNAYDQSISIWINNVPYKLDNFSRKYVPNTLSPLLYHCSNSLFDMEEINFDLDYYMEGRNYYFLKSSIYSLPKEISITSPKENMFGVIQPSYFKTEWCDLSLLICSVFKISKFKKFLEEVEYCNDRKGYCTEIGKKISKSLIKIASTRIFADPEQSILELPVNSLDAYSSSATVGKFGMGFFSILYWLVNHPKRMLTIVSYYSHKEKHIKFVCQIVFNESFQFRLDSHETNVHRTGSYIELNCKDDPFTDDNIIEFEKQLSKLRFTNSSTIAIRKTEKGEFTRFNESDSENNVFVQLCKNGIFVEDYATGISLKVLLTKLFVPSISSKTISMGKKDTLYINNSRIFESEENYFIILVKGICIINLPFVTEIETKYTIIVDLSGDIRVPVSRDDIIIDFNTEESVLESVQIILEKFLSIGNL
jgi:hypothetical protein